VTFSCGVTQCTRISKNRKCTKPNPATKKISCDVTQCTRISKNRKYTKPNLATEKVNCDVKQCTRISKNRKCTKPNHATKKISCDVTCSVRGLVKTGNVPNQTPYADQTKYTYVCYPEELLPDGIVFHVQDLVQVYLDVMSRRLLLKSIVAIFKNYWTTRSAWPEVELRFCPWHLLFKYWTGGSDLNFSLCLLYVSLMLRVLGSDLRLGSDQNTLGCIHLLSTQNDKGSGLCSWI
jgi:hypothetical protein